MIPIRLEYPEDFLKDEIISDYQVSSQMKEIWAIELDLLERIDEICSEHNIRYYASGGTSVPRPRTFRKTSGPVGRKSAGTSDGQGKKA